jgi:hypothetical protein
MKFHFFESRRVVPGQRTIQSMPSRVLAGVRTSRSAWLLSIVAIMTGAPGQPVVGQNANAARVLRGEVADTLNQYVERVSHNTGLQQGQATLSREQAEDLLTGGTERGRQHCATELAKDNYHPGCPVQSKYY